MKWLSITFALWGTGTGIALFRIQHLDPKLRALLFVVTTLATITMAPAALRAINDVYVILRNSGAFAAIRDFFRSEDHQPADRQQTPPDVPSTVPHQHEARQPRSDPKPMASASKPSPEPTLVKWSVTNRTTDNILVKFWSSDTARSWPDSTRVYRIRPGRHRVFLTKCASALHSVCFGAWGTDTDRRTGAFFPLEWGRGIPGDNNCTSCCYRCNGATVPLILAP